MNTCAKCEVRFDGWMSYNTHMQTNTCFKPINPKKVSNRTTAQITEDLEIKLGRKAFFPNVDDAVADMYSAFMKNMKKAV